MNQRIFSLVLTWALTKGMVKALFLPEPKPPPFMPLSPEGAELIADKLRSMGYRVTVRQH